MLVGVEGGVLFVREGRELSVIGEIESVLALREIELESRT